MKDFNYLIENFFTHKDFLAPKEEIPGTLFTPLHFTFAAVLLLFVIASAIYVGKRKNVIKPVFTAIWAVLLIWEVVIVTWESVSGKTVGLDLQTNLSLYPCSIFLYTMPFAIWGKGNLKKIACGYVCTLGLLGAAVNFFYPSIRLATYSCISFVGFHTFAFHGSMLFVCLVMLISHYHRYSDIKHWWETLLPCIPSLILSIPANIINYSKIHADYMFFRGQNPILATLFPNTNEILMTFILYLLYILVPALFYLPFYIVMKKNQFKQKKEKNI